MIQKAKRKEFKKNMSTGKSIGFGVMGGLLGAGAVVGLGALSAYFMRRQEFLPLSLQVQTVEEKPSIFAISAYITRKRGAKTARLHLSPFKVQTASSFSAITGKMSSPILPVTMIPIGVGFRKDVRLHVGDAIVLGTVGVASGGLLSISLTQPSVWAAGTVCGLAEPVEFDYPVA